MRYLKVLSIYGSSVFFNTLISFVTFSVLTHFLNQADYGVINLYNAALALLLPFIAVGVQYALGVGYFNVGEEGFPKLFSNAMVIPVAATVLCTAGILLFLPAIKGILKVNDLFALTLPLACFLTLVVDVFLNLFRNKGAHGLFIGFSLSRNIVETGLILLFVVVLGLHWQGRIGSSLLVLLLAGFFLWYFLRRWRYHKGVISKDAVSRIFYTGLPFVPERLAIFVLGSSDRFFIDHFSGLSQVGLYGTGAQMALIVNLAISTLSNTFHPVLYRGLAGAEKDLNKVRKATFAYIGIAAGIASGVVLFTPLIFEMFIGPLFQKGQSYAVYLTIGMFFWAVYNAFLPFLLINKRNKTIMAISMAGMVVSIAGNFYNVKHYGAVGATYTSIVVYVLMAALVIYFVHKDYNLKRVLGKHREKSSVPHEKKEYPVAGQP